MRAQQPVTRPATPLPARPMTLTVGRGELQQFPDEVSRVAVSDPAIAGVVSEAEVAKQAAAIAGVHAKSVVNLIQSPPPDSRQVMLQVKFATIDRTTLAQLGANFFSVNNKLLGSATTQQFSFPRIGQLQ